MSVVYIGAVKRNDVIHFFLYRTPNSLNSLKHIIQLFSAKIYIVRIAGMVVDFQYYDSMLRTVKFVSQIHKIYKIIVKRDQLAQTSCFVQRNVTS